MIRHTAITLFLALIACTPAPGNETASNEAASRADHQRIDPLKAPPPAK